MRPWYRLLPYPTESSDDAMDLHLHINARMYRRSDNRLMMVSGVHKVIQGVRRQTSVRRQADTMSGHGGD